MTAMIVAFGCDHAGFPLKPRILEAITDAGHEVLDCGAMEVIPDDDYPDYARAVGEALTAGRAEKGVIVCGSATVILAMGAGRRAAAGIRAYLGLAAAEPSASRAA